MLDLSINGMPDKIDLVLGGKTNPNNCDVFKRGSISKTIEGSKVMYEAKDMASVCDYVPLNTYSTLKSYILRFQGEGVAGRGLKYYLYNKGSERNDIEALLGEGLYDKSYFVLNWPKVKESSYVLNIEGRSFGAPSKDRIDSILSYEAPLDWIAGWRLEKPGINTGDKSTEISLENSVTEIGTYKYYVRDNFDAGTIVLSQSYDEGWKTYTTRFQISDVRYQIWKMFPFLFGKELEHVKVNGWGNGWLAEPTGVGYQTSEVRSNISNSGKQDTEIRNPKSDISIVIVYLPQYLEFAGFAILLLGFIAVVAWPTLKRGEKSRYKKIKSLLIR
jgi:hypothetical protein